MSKATPQLILALLKTFSEQDRDLVERDLVALMRPPYQSVNFKVQCRGLPTPIGLLEYALRYGGAASVDVLLDAGADPNDGAPRPLTITTMAQACPDAGRIDKVEALLRAGARPDYRETVEQVPPTPLIALARSKATGIQRYWIARRLREAGASVQTSNDYELRVVARLLIELRAIDGIMTGLSDAAQAGTKATPSSWAGLVDAVLRSEQPSLLRRLIAVKHELKLPFILDPTAALLELSTRIADRPVAPMQADFVRILLEIGAEMQTADGGDSAFERALGFENHELMDIFLGTGAKVALASSPDMAAELMRRQGLPQVPKARPEHRPAPAASNPTSSNPPFSNRALASLDLLCSGIEALESCPEADLGRLSLDHTATMQALARRLHAIADKLAPVDEAMPGV